MALTMRPAGLSSGIDQDCADYIEAHSLNTTVTIRFSRTMSPMLIPSPMSSPGLLRTTADLPAGNLAVRRMNLSASPVTISPPTEIVGTPLITATFISAAWADGATKVSRRLLGAARDGLANLRIRSY